MDRWINGSVDGWIDVWMDQWIDGRGAADEKSVFIGVGSCLISR